MAGASLVPHSGTFVFIALAVLIAAVSVARLAPSEYSLWFDEYATVIFTKHPLTASWSRLVVRENYPTMFYFIHLALLWQIFNCQGLAAMRAP